MEFQIEVDKGLYYLCSENKDADYCTAELRIFSQMQIVVFLVRRLKCHFSGSNMEFDWFRVPYSITALNVGSIPARDRL